MTIINFIKNSMKISIIEHIYNTRNVPIAVKEYQKHIILLDDNNKHIKSLYKGTARLMNPSMSSNWQDGTGMVFGGQGKLIDLNTAQQVGPHNN